MEEEEKEKEGGGGRKRTGGSRGGGKEMQKQTLSCPPLTTSPPPCIFLGDLICLSERENQFMMTIGGPVMKAAQFLHHGKVSPANLGKMNHSHFIWTSVLTPPPLLPHPRLPHQLSFICDSFITTAVGGCRLPGQQECSTPSRASTSLN